MSVTARTQRRSTTAQPGRFARSGAGRSTTSRPTGRRSTTPQRRAGTKGVIRRRPPQQSGMQKAFGALSGSVPGLGGKTRSRSSSRGKGGKAGGVALLTAAAGFAFQNRDKLTAMLRRNRSEQPQPQPQPSVPPTPTGTPTVSP